MDKYYYIVSQMPGLRFDKESTVNVDSFLEEAEKWIGKRDLRTLSKIKFRDTTSIGKQHRVYKDYQEFELTLRSDIANWRKAVRTGDEYKPVSFPASMFKEGDPLEIEKRLLKYRWDYLEEQSITHHFDLGFLILYLLKLQILGKLGEFNKEKGLEKYKQTLSVDLAPYLAQVPEE